MAGADVETVRAAYEAWNRDDPEAVLEYFDPEIVWHPTEQFPEPGPMRGHDGMRRFFASFDQVFGEVRMQPTRIVEGAEPGEVAALIEMRTRGRESGVEVTMRIVHRLRLRDGRIVWCRVYGDADEGLKAAGVPGSS